VYLYDLGKRLRAMFSHRRVEPGSAKFKIRKSQNPEFVVEAPEALQVRRCKFA
jgi:hypothetical protein